MVAATPDKVIAEMSALRKLGLKLREIGLRYGLTANGVHARLTREARKERRDARKSAGQFYDTEPVEVAPGWVKCAATDCERWIRKGHHRLCRDCHENSIRRENRPVEDKPSEEIREMLRLGYQLRKSGA